MPEKDTQRFADEFLTSVVKRLSDLPFATLEAWPDYPETPEFEMRVPAELSEYTFTLMKDTLRAGEIRIAV